MSWTSWVASQGAPSAIAATAISSRPPMIRVGCLRSQRQRPATTGGARAVLAIVIFSIADARIEQPVAEVDQQVDQHVDAGRKQQHALDHRVVVALHRID